MNLGKGEKGEGREGRGRGGKGREGRGRGGKGREGRGRGGEGRKRYRIVALPLQSSNSTNMNAIMRRYK